MRPVQTARRVIRNTDRSAQILAEIREGVANQSSLMNDKLGEMIGICRGLAAMQRAQLDLMAEMTKHLAGNAPDLSRMADLAKRAGLDALSHQRPPVALASGEPGDKVESFRDSMARIPLLLDEKTYNTAHPDYDATKVKNYPGRIFNRRAACKNPVFRDILKMAKGDTVPDNAWEKVLEETLAEAKSVPHANQVFERKTYIERYLADLGRKYQAHYVAGWVNLEDALFLYWLVRRLKPKTIVQTGVCNGLSSAFMMLALAKNGLEGTLHVIDLPAVFNPNDPAWAVKNMVYGVVIPEGKSSGWMVPDAYHDRFEVQVGDAKKLLPPLIDKLDSVDMFYHDSDHTYNHMMFEFREAKKKLRPGGLIVGDDISWNASVWDFADEHNSPSYNYKGAVGVAFF